MRLHRFIVTILIAVSFPNVNAAGSLGTCLGTFEIGRDHINISKENLRAACRAALLQKSAKLTRLAAVVDQTFSEAALAPYGWRMRTRTGAVVTLEGRQSTVPFLSAIDGIVSYQPHYRIFPCMDSARQETHINEVQGNIPNPLTKHFTGKGVLFCILDTEFDTHHPAFVDSLGHTRFIALWDQTDTSGVRRNRFGYGLIKMGDELNTDSLFGSNGFYHGTHMCSLGAGSDRSHPFWGAAPEVTIVAVKYGNSEADIINGILWVSAIADSLKMPSVINLSIGVQSGPHDGTSRTDIVIDSVSRAGRIVVGAAGNDGEQKPHISFPLKARETRGTWITPDTDPTRHLGVVTYADVWGVSGKSFSDTLYVGDLTTTPMQYMKTTRIVPNQSPDTIYWPNAVTGIRDTLVFYVGVETYPVNRKPHMLIYVQGNNPNLIIGMRLTSTQADTVHVWNANKLPFKSLGITGFFDGDSLYTIDEVGGTAKRIITAGGYVSNVALTTWDGKVWGSPGNPVLYNYLSYTSLGPTADGRIKPDISAPSQWVVGAMSRIGKDDNRTVIWPNPKNTLGRYELTGGTSVASPIVAGIIALMLEAKPTLTPETVKQILQQTAIKDKYVPQITPDVRWGAGKVNALGAIEQLGIPVLSVRQSAAARQCFRIVKYGENRLVLMGPAAGLPQEALVELFCVSGRMFLSAHVKTGGVISIPRSAAQGCVIARVRWQGGSLQERLFVGM
jgi:minor extracellular serine protease Vpr